MGGRFWISVVVLFVVSNAIGFIVHGMLLNSDYAQLPNLLRTQADAQNYFPWMLLAHLIMSFGFAWIYVQGRAADRPWLGQGLRFGAAMAVVMTIPIYLIYYAVQPWPGEVVVKQIAYDVVGMLIMGATVAGINNSRKTA